MTIDSIYEFAKRLQRKLEAEAEKLAVRNGESTKKTLEEYRAMAGEIKGIKKAAALVREAIKDINRDIEEDEDEPEPDDE